MKKFLWVLLSLIIFNLSTYATEKIHINDDTFELQYSATNQGNIINEFVRPTENLNNWTDIITAHHFPNVNSKDYYNDMRNHISLRNGYLLINYDDNKQTISFLIIAPFKNKRILEYNTMKIMNTSKGTDVLQWGHRYISSNSEAEIKKILYYAISKNKEYEFIIDVMPMPELKTTFFEKKN